MSLCRCSHQAVVLNDKLYAIGGRGETGATLSSVESLNLQTPNANWTYEPNLSIRRSNFGATIADNKIMVAGGFDGHNIIGDVEWYSDMTKTWTLCQPIQSRMALGLVTVKGLPNRRDYLQKCITEQ